MIIESIARLCALRNEIGRHEDVMRGAREPEAEQRGKTKKRPPLYDRVTNA